MNLALLRFDVAAKILQTSKYNKPSKCVPPATDFPNTEQHAIILRCTRRGEIENSTEINGKQDNTSADECNVWEYVKEDLTGYP
jgi:hypothetical protein